MCLTFPYGLQPVISGLAIQELLPNLLQFNLDSVLYAWYPAHLAIPDSNLQITYIPIK